MAYEIFYVVVEGFGGLKVKQHIPSSVQNMTVKFPLFIKWQAPKNP
jgi:hypothetical protein